MPPLPKTDKVAPSRPTRQQRPSTGSISSLKAVSNSNGNMSSPPTPTGSVRLTMPPLFPSETLSLGVSRPNPPRIRPKRMSATAASTPPSTRSPPSIRSKGLNNGSPKNGAESTSSRTSLDRASLDHSSYEPVYTGSIVEKTEEELILASREALQAALRKEWANCERMAARIDEQEADCIKASDRAAELQSAHEAMVAKYDVLFNEHNMLDTELEAANEVVERLRSNLAESERQNRQGQRRYADQEKAFEAERLVNQAEYQHLQQRIKSLTSERTARPGNDESNKALQEELVTLSASHQTLVAQLTTLADELHEVKSDNSRLQDENDAWQLLIEERTLAGHMHGKLFSPIDDGTEHDAAQEAQAASPDSMHRESSLLETLEEQMEMEELNNEMAAHQSFFDEHPDSQKRASPTKPNGMSLAMELSAAPQMAEMEALRNEIKSLKESNLALSLYCNKILNRVIAHDGYEHILATDYRTRRFGSRSAGGPKSRPSLQDAATAMANGSPVTPEAKAAPPIPTPAPPAPIPTPTVAAPAPAPVTRARPQSMLPVSAAQQALPKPSEIKKDGEKRARRGFSIDFRSLGFGGSEPKPEPKSHLKPLQLASRAAPAGSTPPATTVTTPPLSKSNVVTPPSATARKLEPQEEDEEDRRERHRMEAALKLMGIDRSTPPNETAPLPAATSIESPVPSASGASGWFSRRLSRVTTSTPPAQSASPADGDRANTPLARLPPAAGGESVLNLNDEPGAQDLEAAAAALRAYDEREREQARLLSEGKSQTAFTSPPKLGSRGRRSSSRPSSSSTMSTTHSTSDVNGVHNGTPGHRKKESASTLFSMSSSRASMDCT